MLIFANVDIQVWEDGVSHNHILNYWQCMRQSQSRTPDSLWSTRLRYVSAWFKEPPSISEDRFGKHNFATDSQQGFRCSSCNSNFFY